MRRTLVALSTAAAVTLAGTGAAHAQDLPEQMTYGSQGWDLLSSDSATGEQNVEAVRLLSADYAVGSSVFFLAGLVLHQLADVLPQGAEIPLSTA
ncbi:hypothetical protein [Corynebacterium guangdongense]|uniref:Uncharacterized protein n=1 Tax=Corynebacterium guangdongense TaxID=1783348 RepID=A0ABU1ZWB3_9CORY|nr:hypothetical protein [Corynebacterium guangdongense]MDR7329228.1 hypothetical protein [Corynebacterium guangdongense]WJZ17794.1 hypothetical protein CGUA_06095 [Corynebacterium guangdongense]